MEEKPGCFDAAERAEARSLAAQVERLAAVNASQENAESSLSPESDPEPGPDSTPPPEPEPEPPPPPRDTLVIQGLPDYGQGFASGPCANWTLNFVNQSNIEIVQVTFKPPSGQYSNFKEFNQETQQHAPPIPAERPAPAVLNLSLPPYGEQLIRFQTCTRTSPPDNPNYEFGARAPSNIPFRWVTGHEGVVPQITSSRH